MNYRSFALSIMFASYVGAATAQTFPDFHGGNSVTLSGIPINVVTLYIPADHEIHFSPEAGEIVWTVEHIVFESNALIDLTKPYVIPKASPNGADVLTQSPICKAGEFGGNGSDGTPGQAGRSLTFRGVKTIDNQGSLWIRTDGTPGGDAGKGGRGGVGGGHGGQGGAGGATSIVKFEHERGLRRPNLRFVSGCTATCEPSQRPDEAKGPVGVLVIWGGSGCGGKGGIGGDGGPPGGEGAGYGPRGQDGAAGIPGACTSSKGWDD